MKNLVFLGIVVLLLWVFFIRPHYQRQRPVIIDPRPDRPWIDPIPVPIPFPEPCPGPGPCPGPHKPKKPHHPREENDDGEAFKFGVMRPFVIAPFDGAVRSVIFGDVS